MSGREGERVVTLDGYRYLHFPLLFLLSPLPKQVRPMFEAKNKEKTITRITEIWPVSWSINYKVPTKACQQFRYETVLVPRASYGQTFNLLNLTGELYYSGLVFCTKLERQKIAFIFFATWTPSANWCCLRRHVWYQG